MTDLVYNDCKISSWQLLGEGNDKLVVVLPGFLDSKDYPHLTELGKDLHARGFDAVGFDPVGTWDSEGGVEEYCVSAYIDQVLFVVEVFRAMKTYDKVVLAGHSLGGFVSILSAARLPVDGVVSIMAPPAVARDSNKEKYIQWKETGVRYSKRDEPGNLESFREFSVPSGFLEDSLQHDAMEVVGNISCPILFLAGDLDTGVTPDDVGRMFNVAKDPKKFVVIEGAGHDYRRSTDLIEQVNGCTIDFLTINNLV